MKTFFLHFGPGGNANAEIKWPFLSNSIEAIDVSLWEKRPNHFKEYLDGHRLLLDNHEDIHLVGHSFGCDVALALAKHLPKRVQKMTLVSPLHNLPENFVNLARTVGKLTDDQELCKIIPEEGHPAPEGDALFQMLGMAYGHLEAVSSQWQSASMFQKWGAIQSEAAPLDFPYWMGFMAGYIDQEQVYQDIDTETLQKTQIFLGENDPYLNHLDRNFWEAHRSQLSRLIMVPSVGHFCHLENQLSI